MCAPHCALPHVHHRGMVNRGSALQCTTPIAERVHGYACAPETKNAVASQIHKLRLVAIEIKTVLSRPKHIEICSCDIAKVLVLYCVKVNQPLAVDFVTIFPISLRFRYYFQSSTAVPDVCSTQTACHLLVAQHRLFRIDCFASVVPHWC